MAKYKVIISTPVIGIIARAGIEFPSPEAKAMGLTEDAMLFLVDKGRAIVLQSEKEKKEEEKEKIAEEFDPNKSELDAPKQFKAHSYTSMKVDVAKTRKLEEEAKKDTEKELEHKEEKKIEKKEEPKAKKTTSKRGRPKSKSGEKK